MPTFTAALFATTNRQHQPEQSIRAHAILTEGHRPCWEIHVGDKIFRFIPDTRHIIEDGIWQLMDYCQIPEYEYAHDVHYNAPITLEEEFGRETCVSRRATLTKDLIDAGINISLMTWPGIDEYPLNESLSKLKEADINIIHHHITL